MTIVDEPIEKDKQEKSHNLILWFSVMTGILFGMWQGSSILMHIFAGGFMLFLLVWASHLFAYVMWRGDLSEKTNGN